MSRSPLAYPLNRAADMDVGGAADLQTDVMRFMAILSLCLVAIFALVQSLPMTPVAVPIAETEPESDPEPEPEPQPQPQPQIIAPQPVAASPLLTKPKPAPKKAITEKAMTETVVLTRPKRTPKPPLEVREDVGTEINTVSAVASPPVAQVAEKEGFTLRFESDSALTRLVAASEIGVYAINNDRAQRMTVSESRISFWDASTPNSFHEMETSTVPASVIDALARSGAETSGANWGVTLPGKLKNQLDGLMQEHRGGSLVIGANGTIYWEAS